MSTTDPTARLELTASTFVELVDTLVDDFDVIDLMTTLTTRCIDLLDATAAGILLADPRGNLRVVVASTDAGDLLELIQIQTDEGPCLDSFRTGRIVTDAHLDDAPTPWPVFARASVGAGFPSVAAIPLRLKDRILGGLNLFMDRPEELPATDLGLAQALADVATIAIVQNEATRHALEREGQLQHALDSRIAVEQAKGMLAQWGGTDMHQAFLALRDHARSNNLKLAKVAADVVAGQIPLATFARAPHRR